MQIVATHFWFLANRSDSWQGVSTPVTQVIMCITFGDDLLHILVLSLTVSVNLSYNFLSISLKLSGSHSLSSGIKKAYSVGELPLTGHFLFQTVRSKP